MAQARGQNPPSAAGDAAKAAAEKLVAAKAALDKALAEEKAANDEWNSREMARSATREIIVSARATVEKSLQDQAAAEEALKQKAAAAKAAADAAAAEADQAKKPALEAAAQKAAAELAAAEKLVAQRVASTKTTADRLETDRGVGYRAVADLIAIENRLGAAMAASRAAEKEVLLLELEAAKQAATQAEADKATAEKNVTERMTAAKAAAERAADEADAEKKKVAQEASGKAAAELGAAVQSLGEKTSAARKAAEKVRTSATTVCQIEAVAPWEAQEWISVQRDTLQQYLSAKTGDVDTAQKLVAVEKDPERKKVLEAAAAKAAAEKAELEKNIAAQTAAIQAATPKIAALRAVARGGLKPLAPESWDYAKARHLLVRAGFGGTPQEVEKLCAMGLHQAVDYLVEFNRQPAANVPFDAVVPTAADPIEGKFRNAFVQSRIAGARASVENGQIGRLRNWWLRRMVESPRPLQEKLTLFWHGHFATQYSVVQHGFTTYNQNQLFREHAAGNFGGLLYGIVHDPDMIRYLDNNTNVKGHANENLAREIMELFAMGVDQGYTEKDIREAARALTGYTFDRQTGQFRFVANLHDTDPKSVFGKTGNYTGDDLVSLILEQPSTSRFIAKKLFEYFAYADPSPEVVDQLASVLKSNQYELGPMLKNLFTSEEFYSSKATNSQVKSPVQLVVGTLRDLGVKQVSDPGALDAALREMGQELFEPPDVKGWRGGRAWINTSRVFTRYNSMSNLVKTIAQPNNRRGADAVALLEGSGAKSCSEVVDYLAKACFVKPLDDAKRKELIAFLGEMPPPDQWAAGREQLNPRLQSLLALMLSTPEHQMN
jgi:uncharacterized protein (DUF1800 family)